MYISTYMYFLSFPHLVLFFELELTEKLGRCLDKSQIVIIIK